MFLWYLPFLHSLLEPPAPLVNGTFDWGPKHLKKKPDLKPYYRQKSCEKPFNLLKRYFKSRNEFIYKIHSLKFMSKLRLLVAESYEN